jgi:hypothetical protein
MTRILLLACVLGFVTSTASADAIIMPPSCPAGSMNAFCHGPPTCAPRTCTASSSCSPGEVCMPVALCTSTNVCGGGLGPSTSLTNVYGACDASGACAMGSCSTMSVCMAGSATDGGTSDGGGVAPMHAAYCGCRAGTHGGTTLAIGGLLIALGLVARRRNGG